MQARPSPIAPEGGRRRLRPPDPHQKGSAPGASDLAHTILGDRMLPVEKAALRVVGISVMATWDQLWTEMPRGWRHFFSRHAEIPRS